MFRLTPLIEQALCLAYWLHHRQTDKGGIPYIFHPYNVAERCAFLYDHNFQLFEGKYIDYETLICLALMHDTIEDTPLTLDTLQVDFKDKKDFEKSLDLLTRKKGQSKENYLQEILEAETIYPLVVKLMDLTENLRADRITNNVVKQANRNAIYSSMYNKILSELLHRCPEGLQIKY